MKRLAWTGNIMKFGSNEVSGAIVNATAGENLVFGNVCYYKTDKYYKANADSVNTISTQLVMALETIAQDATGWFLEHGFVSNSGWSLNTGAQIYISGTTSGLITETQPSTSIKIIGMADSATSLYFNGSMEARNLETELYLASSVIYDGEIVTYNDDIVTY